MQASPHTHTQTHTQCKKKHIYTNSVCFVQKNEVLQNMQIFYPSGRLSNAAGRQTK